MAIYEKRYQRNGVPMPIQCLMMKKEAAKKFLDYHYHDYIELLFGISGRVNAYVGTECYPLEKGSMVLIHKNEFHEVEGTGEASSYIVVKFLPSVFFTEEQTFSEYTYALLLMQNTHVGKCFFSARELEDTPISALFLQMMEEWEGERFGYELGLRANVTSIMMHIMRKWQMQNPSLSAVSVSSAQSELIQEAITYIDNHYTDISQVACADALNVSPAYLSRIFKKGMKTSFCSYVNAVKLKAAEKLLLSGDASMTEIAEQVGFSTVAYFIASFRERYRITPNQYRKRLRGIADVEEETLKNVGVSLDTKT